jgi:predicted nucleic acid-binding Zn finger protein
MISRSLWKSALSSKISFGEHSEHWNFGSHGRLLWLYMCMSQVFILLILNYIVILEFITRYSLLFYLVPCQWNANLICSHILLVQVDQAVEKYRRIRVHCMAARRIQPMSKIWICSPCKDTIIFCIISYNRWSFKIYLFLSPQDRFRSQNDQH